jgi:riboflavin kinase / FMN adenylyltransferase
MKIIDSIPEFNLLKKGSVLTIGNFDGVHLGHREILNSARSAADQRQADLIVMTFEPHPVAVLRPEIAPGVLTPLPLKEFLLSGLNVDCLIVIKDNKALLELSPEDFVKWFLVENIKPGLIVEGDDFNFGAGRAGNIETLKNLSKENKFAVNIINPATIKLSNDQVVRVSSTMIRYMLESGHVGDAGIALGRPYRLIEEIVSGRGVGRKLGFPTLNLQIPNQVIPAEGVYAGFVRVSDDLKEIISCPGDIPAIYSIGQARTYGDDFPLLIEAHLLCENAENISGKYMGMDFIRRIRSQHKFKTPEKLAAQIEQDCNEARRILQDVVIN